MKQGRKFLSLCAALIVIGAAMPLPTQAASHRSNATAAASKSKKNGTRQFSGTVTAIDKDGFTVEKHGKQAKTMVFSKHAEMKSSGDVEKNARVTVYYREEGGRAVAMRVVVKPQSTAAIEH
jgi:hypothetical protein